MATFRDLANPLDELAEALAALIEPPTPDPLEFDWRAAGAELPSLLDQLEDAVESSSSRGGKASSIYKSPAHLDVVALLTDIDRYVLRGLRRSRHHPWLNGRAELLRAWSSHARRWSEDDLRESVGQVRRWVTRAENILTPDPQTIETQAQPCPQCKRRTAMVWSDEIGEHLQRPSLYLDMAILTVVCRCCGECWPSPMFGFLSRLLEENRSASATLRSAR